jgi:hypothetical protein
MRVAAENRHLLIIKKTRHWQQTTCHFCQKARKQRVVSKIDDPSPYHGFFYTKHKVSFKVFPLFSEPYIARHHLIGGT